MTCGQYICYLTDVDENGDLTEFHHCTEAEGFCSMLPLFTVRKATDEACNNFIQDKEN